MEDIADRLHDRFSLPTGGSRTALPRQRTLEATVAWSYDLLDEDERALFTWLSYHELEAVFASPHGEEALRRMVRATFRLWDRGWPFVAFTLRARRIDRELGA